MAVIGDLVTRLSVDGRNFQNGLSKAQGQAKSFASNVASIVSGIAIADIGGKAIGGILSLGQSVAKLAADAQTAQIQFEVLTGSAEKGAALFKDVERFAARTSFNLESAADASKGLMAAGVSDTAVIPTLQLLGDLAMGDSVKLGFLSKAYTDVMNKGRLQGQEIRQFSENGVGLIGALSKTLNKSTSEILSMSEAGQISFTDMQKALMSLIGEGGRFHNMMERINTTFTGQWNSLVENVQTLGREIGTAVLPNLTSMVTVANEILQKFNMLPDKMKFLSDVISASSEIAALKMEEVFVAAINRILDKIKQLGAGLAEAVNPSQNSAGNWSDPEFVKAAKETPVWQRMLFGDAAVKMRQSLPGFNLQSTPDGQLQQAQERLNTLMSQLQAQQLPPAPAANNLAAGLPAAVDGSKLANLFGKAMEKTAPLVAGVKQFGMTKVAEWQTWGEGLLGTLSNWLGDGTKETNKQTSGAMFKDQAEAFSAIVNAMMGGKQDPLLKETKEQTVQVVKAIKTIKPAIIPVVLDFLT